MRDASIPRSRAGCFDAGDSIRGWNRRRAAEVQSAFLLAYGQRLSSYLVLGRADYSSSAVVES